MENGKGGRPGGLFVFKRENKYDPDRVHLAVFNWDKSPVIKLDLNDILKKGEKYRIVDVRDIWGSPVKQGAYDGRGINMSLTGPYAPEFACYLLLRN